MRGMVPQRACTISRTVCAVGARLCSVARSCQQLLCQGGSSGYAGCDLEQLTRYVSRDPASTTRTHFDVDRQDAKAQHLDHGSASVPVGACGQAAAGVSSLRCAASVPMYQCARAPAYLRPRTDTPGWPIAAGCWTKSWASGSTAQTMPASALADRQQQPAHQWDWMSTLIRPVLTLLPAVWKCSELYLSPGSQLMTCMEMAATHKTHPSGSARGKAPLLVDPHQSNDEHLQQSPRLTRDPCVCGWHCRMDRDSPQRRH